MNKFKFPKTLKLKKEKSISELFEHGYSFSRTPLRVLWCINKESESVPVKSAFTVSKKKFKRAVDRNLIKRRMREAYRINKNILFDNSSQLPAGLEIIFVYTSVEIHSFTIIRSSLIALLKHLAGKIAKDEII
jgi:ribonuclease P protein component